MQLLFIMMMMTTMKKISNDDDDEGDDSFIGQLLSNAFFLSQDLEGHITVKPL